MWQTRVGSHVGSLKHSFEMREDFAPVIRRGCKLLRDNRDPSGSLCMRLCDWRPKALGSCPQIENITAARVLRHQHCRSCILRHQNCQLPSRGTRMKCHSVMYWRSSASFEPNFHELPLFLITFSKYRK